MKAMILAAGMGTRLRPLTDNKPKALVEVKGKTLLEHAILNLKQYGVDEVIINIHHCKEQIIEFIKHKNSFGIRIEFSDELDQLLETGGGLKKASWFFDDNKPFVLVAVDIATNLDIAAMYQTHLKSNALITLAVKDRETTRKFIFDTTNALCGWQHEITGDKVLARRSIGETRAIGFSVVHIIDPTIFNLITEEGAFSLRPLYLRLANEHFIQAYYHQDDVWLEFGRLEKVQHPEKLDGIDKVFNL